jgi:hypothetical protein
VWFYIDLAYLGISSKVEVIRGQSGQNIQIA